MKLILINLLSFILTIYIAAIIVFKQYYFNNTHIINAALLIIFIILMFYEKKQKYKINAIIVTYAFFVIIALASSLWGIDFDNPSYKALQLFVIFINMFIIYNLVKKYNLINTFFNGVLLGSLINYLIMFHIIQVPFEIYSGSGLGARAVGTMGNPNILTTAMLMSMLVSMIYLFRDKKMNILFYYYQYINIFLAIYLIVLTVSKKGIILGSLLFIAYFILLLRNKKGILQISVMTIIGIFLVQFFIDKVELYALLEYVQRRFDNFATGLTSINTTASAASSTAIRAKLIEFGLVTFQESPLIGYGLDNFRVLTGTHYAHNTPVELLVGVGLVGLIVYYSMHFFLLQKIYRMQQSELKYLLYFFILSILLMDLTTVSYGSKLILFAMVYISIVAESEKADYTENK